MIAFAEFISNFMFCSVFALAGINHIKNFQDEIPKLTSVGIPEEYASICFGTAIGLQLLGTVLIMIRQFETFGYLCYILFLIPVTWFMHVVPLIMAYYHLDDQHEIESKDLQMVQFNLIQTMKNISLLGACLKFMLNANQSNKSNQVRDAIQKNGKKTQ